VGKTADLGVVARGGRRRRRRRRRRRKRVSLLFL